MKAKLYSTFLFLLIPFFMYSQKLAFPGAEGFGRFAEGGRRGTVYQVTNLNDSGTGSLRDAVSQPNRVVVFTVSGVIKIKTRMIFSSNLTIAGQTAPGDGITVYGNGVTFSGAKDVICRYIRFRMGSSGDSGKDAAGLANGSNMIFDHVSVSWGLDENFSISWDNKGTEPGNITIQNSIISQGLQSHSCGGLIQTDGGVTLFRNLYIDNKTRNPKVKGLNQFVNNVVYNWGSGGGYILGDTEGASWATIVNNYFIKGPSTTVAPYTRATSAFQLYATGNMYDGDLDGVLNGTESVQADYGPAFWVESSDYWKTSTPTIPQMHPVIESQMSTADAYSWVVNKVGCSLPMRDAPDEYVIDELLSFGKKGYLITSQAELGIANNAVGYVFCAPALVDSDKDGIPDKFEELLGTDKNVDDAMVIGTDGYTNIERYVNSIDAPIAYLKYPLNIRAVSRTMNEIGLSWTNLETKATSVKIEQSLDNTIFTEVKSLAGDATTGVVDQLAKGTLYYFRLRATSDDLGSLYSDVFSIQTDDEAAAPLASMNVAPKDEFELEQFKNVTLSWSNISNQLAGQLSYAVYLGKSSLTLNLEASNLSSTSLILPQLEENTTYYWRVDATNLLGTTASSIWSFKSGRAIQREMLLYFPFDETTGSDAVDLVDDQLAKSYDFEPVWSAGKIGNALTLSAAATNAHLKVTHTDALLLDKSSFTISLWFRSLGSPDIYLMHKGSHVKTTTGGTGRWFGIQYKSPKLVFGVDDDVTKTTIEVTASSKFDNQWHHLACVRDIENKKIIMYMDGVLFGEKTDGTGSVGEVSDLIIGNCNVNFNTPYKGDLDEFKLFNAALRADEILDIYQNATTGVIKHTNSTNMSVYPNPFSNELNLYFPSTTNLENSILTLTDLAGTVILKAASNVLDGNVIQLLGLDKIAPGMYVLSVENKSGLFVQKVIK